MTDEDPVIEVANHEAREQPGELTSLQQGPFGLHLGHV
jgi:hypothetical protein